jgi:hypothetical protein
MSNPTVGVIFDLLEQWVRDPSGSDPAMLGRAAADAFRGITQSVAAPPVPPT